MSDWREQVIQAQNGDLAAFDAVVRRFQDMAAGYAYALVGDFHLAQDVAQEAFIQAHRDLPSLKTPAAFPGWLRRILFKYADRLKRRKLPVFMPIEVLSALMSSDADQADRDFKMAVMEAVNALPDPQRIVVTLFYIEDYTHQEIADFLGVASHTIDNRLRAARKQLKERLLFMAKKTLQEQAPSSDEALVDIVSLCTAAEAGHVERVRRILEATPALTNYKDPAGRMPLHYAVFGGHTETARVLVEAGCDPLWGLYPVREFTTPLAMAQDRGLDDMAEMMMASLNERKGTTPHGELFCQAIREGRLEQVYSMMQDDPESIHATDMNGDTGLHVAALCLHRQLVNDLLERGAEVDRRGDEGRRPIEAILARYDLNAMANMTAGVLLAHGAVYDIWVAAALGDLAGVQAFLEEDPSLANYNNSRGYGNRSILFPLTVAARNGYREIVEVLLDHKADPDAAIHTDQISEEHPDGFPESGMPLLYAMDKGYDGIAHLLLDRGARADANGVYAGPTPGHMALNRTDKALGDRLLLNGGRPMLYTYVEEKHYAVLTELLRPSKGWAHQSELDPGYVENLEQILHWGIYFGDAPLVKLCLDQKPSLENAEWFRHLSQLWRRVAGPAEQRADVLALVLDYGVNPNVRSGHGMTLLHHIFECSRDPDESEAIKIALSRVLLDHGADINALDDNLHASPLAWRCMYDEKAVAAYLLERGADLDAAGAPWATPLAWAERRGHREIAALLRERGARN